MGSPKNGLRRGLRQGKPLSKSKPSNEIHQSRLTAGRIGCPLEMKPRRDKKVPLPTARGVALERLDPNNCRDRHNSWRTDMIAPIETPPTFRPVQLVKHRRYGYRGVVVDFDSFCKAPEQWYQANQTQPDQNQPCHRNYSTMSFSGNHTSKQLPPPEAPVIVNLPSYSATILRHK